MRNLSQTRLRMAAVFIAALISHAALASEHIIIDVAPNDNLGAGFGELSPGFHDLRVTVNASGGDHDMVGAWDSSGMTMWDVETQTSSSVTLLSQDAQEDNMGAVSVDGMIMDPIDTAIMYPFNVGIANVLWPCASCGMDEFGMPLCAAPNNEMGMCDTSQEGEVEICFPRAITVNVGINHTAPGTLTILGATSDIEILNPDETPFTSAYVTSETSVPIVIRAEVEFIGEVNLIARFIQDNAQVDTQDIVKVKVKDVYECVDVLNFGFGEVPQ